MVHMASRDIKTPPAIQVGLPYESWVKEIRIRQRFTNLEQKKQGLAIFLSLEGKAREIYLLFQSQLIFYPQFITFLWQSCQLHVDRKTQSSLSHRFAGVALPHQNYSLPRGVHHGSVYSLDTTGLRRAVVGPTAFAPRRCTSARLDLNRLLPPQPPVRHLGQKFWRGHLHQSEIPAALRRLLPLTPPPGRRQSPPRTSSLAAAGPQYFRRGAHGLSSWTNLPQRRAGRQGEL